jgi:energy-converting hydrogenase Eha subunit E
MKRRKDRTPAQCIIKSNTVLMSLMECNQETDPIIKRMMFNIAFIGVIGVSIIFIFMNYALQ